MDTQREKACCCALNRVFGFEPRVALELIKYFGSASEVFRDSGKEADNILGPYSKHKGKISPKAEEDAMKELEKLQKCGISFTGWTEKDYPGNLKECDDAPAGLYIRSDTPAGNLWDRRKLIAIIGTRDVSPYGKDWCERIISALADCKDSITIVSGLALGTDISAHKVAIREGIPTIGVMATGPERIYPSSHYDFGIRMTHTDECALITDYPPGTPPLAIHFLRRNRIIAGLCSSTILIESKIKGGGMNTSRLAFSYSRDIYALPGRVDDIRSQGCNILIREKTAEPITDIDTLIENLNLSRQSTESPGKCINDKDLLAASCQVNDSDIDRMCAILIEIRNQRGITTEEISLNTGLDFMTVSRLSAILEAEGFINTDLLQRCSINTKKI